MRRFAALGVAVTAAAIVSVAGDSFAFRMVPMNLAEMSAAAERIVVGVCLAREEGEQPVSPGGPSVRYTQYTFQVSDRIKGAGNATLTIRQVRFGQRRSSLNGEAVQHEILPLPDYQPGQEVLLFLGGDSSLGLTSPVALDQAVFDVEVQDGRKILKHRFKNRMLFRDMPARQFGVSRELSSDETSLFSVREGEPLPYEAFLGLVRKLANGN
jgi:hypothetical protein